MSPAGFDPAGLDVMVTGLAPAGFAAADALLERGARVTVLDPGAVPGGEQRAEILRTLGADVVALAPQDVAAAVAARPWDLLVAGGDPIADPQIDRAAVEAATAGHVPTWSEAELAWRLRRRDDDAWLVVGGTQRRGLVADLCAAVLTRAGLRTAAVGAPGRPVLEQVLHPDPPRVLVVELDPWQAGLTRTISPTASACTWLGAEGAGEFGDPETMRAAAATVYRDTRLAALYTPDDPHTEHALREVDVVEGCRAVAVGLGVPAVSALGIVEDVLCDRAFVPDQRTSAAELGTLDDVAACFGGLLAPDLVRAVLIAAGLARAIGVPPAAVRDALRAPGPLRGAPRLLGTSGGTAWIVDDDAAGLPGAVTAVTAALGRGQARDVVWIADAAAGAPGEPVQTHLARIRPVLRRVLVLDGPRTGTLLRDLARHAPDLPVDVVGVPDTGDVSTPTSTPVEAPTWAVDLLARAGTAAAGGAAVVWAGGGAGATGAHRWRRLTDGFVTAAERAVADGGRGPAGEG